MDMRTAELVAKIKDDIGVEKVILRPVGVGEWAILQPIDFNRAETIYRSKTKEECENLLKLCWEGV